MFVSTEYIPTKHNCLLPWFALHRHCATFTSYLMRGSVCTLWFVKSMPPRLKKADTDAPEVPRINSIQSVLAEQWSCYSLYSNIWWCKKGRKICRYQLNDHNEEIHILITMLSEMKQLEHLSLQQLGSVEGDFSILARHPSLIQISISAWSCTSATLKSILRLENLDTIIVEHAGLRGGLDPVSEEVCVCNSSTSQTACLQFKSFSL